MCIGSFKKKKQNIFWGKLNIFWKVSPCHDLKIWSRLYGQGTEEPFLTVSAAGTDHLHPAPAWFGCLGRDCAQALTASSWVLRITTATWRSGKLRLPSKAKMISLAHGLHPLKKNLTLTSSVSLLSQPVCSRVSPHQTDRINIYSSQDPVAEKRISFLGFALRWTFTAEVVFFCP